MTRTSNSLVSLAITVADIGIVGAVEQLRREHDLVGAALLGLQPRRARPQSVERLGDDGEAGLGHGLVEPHHDIAGLDEIAVAHPHLADHAAGRVLHLLDVGIDHDRARRDQRAGDLRRRGPAAEPAGQHQDQREADDQMRADRAVARLSARLGHDLRNSRFGHDLDRRRRRRRRCCSTWPSTVSFGPNACMRPSFSTSSMIDRLDADRPVRHHDHDAAALAHAADRPRQRLVALGVEIGVRLVEHDQERIAIERARQRDALRLAGRSAVPCSPIWVS